ncbi:MAG: iron-sulfur cluster assembly scaffold protein [Deltaproteobacteria bacterium]|nr:iron-sulfur cluster assembly scaffold protein [Deltaproteobacteria bacterium]
MKENKIHQQKPNFSREPDAHYLEMATRMDRRGIIKDPDGHGKKTGKCGDTVEMFLIVRKNHIHSISFITDGCINTHACANTVAFIAEGKTVSEAWEITPEKVIDFLKTLPKEHMHCAELAVGAFYLALVNFQEYKHAPWKRLYGR